PLPPAPRRLAGVPRRFFRPGRRRQRLPERLRPPPPGGGVRGAGGEDGGGAPRAGRRAGRGESARSGAVRRAGGGGGGRVARARPASSAWTATRESATTSPVKKLASGIRSSKTQAEIPSTSRRVRARWASQGAVKRPTATRAPGSSISSASSASSGPPEAAA